MPSREVDKDPKKFWSHWNLETKQVILVGDEHTCHALTDLYIFISCKLVKMLSESKILLINL